MQDHSSTCHISGREVYTYSTRQEVILFDFDDKVGRREVVIQVLGEGESEKK